MSILQGVGEFEWECPDRKNFEKFIGKGGRLLGTKEYIIFLCFINYRPVSIYINV